MSLFRFQMRAAGARLIYKSINQNLRVGTDVLLRARPLIHLSTQTAGAHRF